MSSGTIPPDTTAPSAPAKRRVTKSETLIDQRIQQTRRQVRLTDLTAAGLVLVSGAILYFLLAALADHWLIPGGLGFWGRLAAFVGLFAAMGAYIWYAVLPLLRYRINPIFAAQSLEQVRPSLKNGLVNLLFLSREQDRTDRDNLSKKVLRGLERTAAAELAEVPVELAVDRSHVVKLGYLLVGVLAVACLYLVLSPKNPLVSVRRVLLPWANVDRPTRVSIDRIEPGNVRAFQGDTLTVSAEILGLKESEQPTLVFSTADGQSIHQEIPLTAGDAFRFLAALPPGSDGLQQNVTYYLTAGDARSSEFVVRVEPALSITVDAVDYDYPDYTGIDDRIDTKTADLRAIEGTRVTLHATTSQPIKQSAVELNCDPRQRLSMTNKGTNATAQFALTMREDNPNEPRYESYQLRATDSEGRQNRRPSRHEIEVIRDRPPEIHLIDPPPEKIELPENGLLELQIQAEDPDFGLRRVALIAERDEPVGGKLRISPMLERNHPEPAHVGSFEGMYRLVPSKLGLKAGDRVIYWAEATDNRPNPNLRETERRWITITAPAPGEQNPKPEETQQEGAPEENKQDKGEEGKQPSEEGKQPSEEGNEAGEEGNEAGEEGNEAGEEGNEAGEEGNEAGEEGNEAGEEGNQAGEEGKQAGEEGNQAGEEGNQAGEEGNQAGEEGKQTGEESTGNKPSPPGSEAGDSGESEGQPIDGDTAPGDAIRKILEHKEKSGETSTDAETNPGQNPSGKGEQPSPDDGNPAETGDPQPQSGDPSEKKDPKESGPSSETPSGTPEPQGDNKERSEGTEPKPSEVGSEPEAESPSISPKESTAKGETSGTRSGEGEKGGGQESPQPGTDTPGSSTPADQGANRANEKGEGETGPNAGDQVQADQPSEVEGQKEPGQQDGQNGKSGGSNTPGQPKKPSSNVDTPASDSATKPPDQPSSQNQEGDIRTGKGGNASIDDQNRNKLRDSDLKPKESPGAEAVNREFAKKQTELALEHLEEQMASDEPELLDRLGWSEAEAEKFLNQWNDMFRAAERPNAQGRKAQHELDRALNSLGLRPSGTEIQGGAFTKDQQKKLEGRRFAPPAEWIEQFRAYNRAIAGQKSDR